MKYVIFYLILFFSGITFAQDILLERPVNLNPTVNGSWKSYHLHNTLVNQHALFFVEPTQIKAYLLDSTFGFLRRQAPSYQMGKYKQVLGVNAQNDLYQLVFSKGKDLSKFRIGSFNMKDSTLSFAFSETNIRDQKLIGTFNYKGKLYLFTILKNSSVLFLHQMNDTGVWVSRKVDFSEYPLQEGDYGNLYTILLKAPNKLQITRIDPNIPSSIDMVACPNKWYVQGDAVYLTLDNLVQHTQVLKISLKEETREYKKYPFPKLSYTPEVMLSNSFLLKDKLFQIKTCRDSLIFSSTDLATANVERTEVLVRRKEPGQGGIKLALMLGLMPMVDGEGVTTSGAFLRHMVNSTHVGISVFQQNDQYQLLIGCYKAESKNALINTKISGTKYDHYFAPGKVRFLPSFGSKGLADSYSYFEEVREVKTLDRLNKEETNKNPFLKIQNFTNELEGKTFCNSYFAVDDYIVYGYFDQAKGRYYLRRFW